MNIDTVGDGIGWSCEALIHLGHEIQTVAGRKDKTLSKFERIASSLWQCRASRPEYNSIALGKPFSTPERFPSLEIHRKAVCTVLNRVVSAVKREMLTVYHESTTSRSRGRSSDESFAWGIEQSPFIASVTDAINRIEDVEITSEVEEVFRTSQLITEAKAKKRTRRSEVREPTDRVSRAQRALGDLERVVETLCKASRNTGIDVVMRKLESGDGFEIRMVPTPVQGDTPQRVVGRTVEIAVTSGADGDAPVYTVRYTKPRRDKAQRVTGHDRLLRLLAKVAGEVAAGSK